MDWASGYIIGYGWGSAPPNLTNPARRWAAGRKSAYIEASRNLLRLCYDLTVQDNLTVRDYVGADTELQAAIREWIHRLPPWGIRMADGQGVRLAMKLPLGGSGGLSEFIGSLAGEVRVEGAASSGLTSGYPQATEGRTTGIVLLASRHHVVPALRPRIREGSGRLLVNYESAAAVSRSRPAFVAYYDSLERAMQDPVVGANPVVVAADSGLSRGTDLVLPRFLEEGLLKSPEGGEIASEVRLVVVLQ